MQGPSVCGVKENIEVGKRKGNHLFTPRAKPFTAGEQLMGEMGNVLSLTGSKCVWSAVFNIAAQQ